MSLRDDLNEMTPRLRRYARVLINGNTGASEAADDIIHATLMRALGARHIGGAGDLPIRLYATVTQLNRESMLTGSSAIAAGAGRLTLVNNNVHFPSAVRQTKLSARLLELPLEEREALLLVALEGFDHAEAARILRISRTLLIERLTKARTALETGLSVHNAASRKAKHAPYLRLVT